jgi:hypothetical protein
MDKVKTKENRVIKAGYVNYFKKNNQIFFQDHTTVKRDI